MMDSLLYCLLVIAAYPYIIYPLLSFLLSLFKNIPVYPPIYPSVTVLIAAYNEIDCIRQKLDNTFGLHYPSDKLEVIVVTDGSTDGTDVAVATDGRAKLLHDTKRKGKAGAINGALGLIKTQIVVCTDANTMLNKEALAALVTYFQDSNIGAVAGEKRVVGIPFSDDIPSEAFYWKYESTVRYWDSKIFSVTGAAGELYAIRTALLRPIPEDTICEDLLITMRVIEEGKRVVYEPLAYGTEHISPTIHDEWKRKLRIAAGGFQFFQRMKLWSFCTRQPVAAFQFISRKLFRWLIVPYILLLMFPLSVFLVFNSNDNFIQLISIIQLLLYGWAAFGYCYNRNQHRSGLVYFPFYFLMANIAIIAGTFQYVKGKSFILWEKAKR